MRNENNHTNTTTTRERANWAKSPAIQFVLWPSKYVTIFVLAHLWADADCIFFVFDFIFLLTCVCDVMYILWINHFVHWKMLLSFARIHSQTKNWFAFHVLLHSLTFFVPFKEFSPLLSIISFDMIADSFSLSSSFFFFFIYYTFDSLLIFISK